MHIFLLFRISTSNLCFCLNLFECFFFPSVPPRAAPCAVMLPNGLRHECTQVCKESWLRVPAHLQTCSQTGLHNSNPCMPQQPLAHTRVSRASRRDSPPDQPCGLKITAVSIPSVLRPFQAQLWHQVSGTVSRAGISLSEERGRVRGQLREPYQPCELFPWC